MKRLSCHFLEESEWKALTGFRGGQRLSRNRHDRLGSRAPRSRVRGFLLDSKIREVACRNCAPVAVTESIDGDATLRDDLTPAVPMRSTDGIFSR